MDYTDEEAEEMFDISSLDSYDPYNPLAAPLPNDRRICWEATGGDSTRTRNPAGRVIQWFGIECRNKFQFVTDTPSDRKIARDFIYRSMVDRKMRVTHIAEQLPLAVEVALTPTKSELRAKELRASQTAIARKDAYAATVYRFYRKDGDFLPWYHLVDRGVSPI